MTWYIVLYLVVGVYIFSYEFLQSEQKKKIATIVLLGILFFMSGTRLELAGSDYYIYKTGYEAVPNLFGIRHIREATVGINLVDIFEWGFLFFWSVLKTFRLSFYGFLVVEAAIWYLCMYYGLKKYITDWTIAIPIFLYKLFAYNTFISMRQSLTIALFFVAIRLIEERKVVWYYIICIIALSIHNGAIIMFPLYPLFQIELNKQRLYAYNAVCWPIYLLSFIGINVYTVVYEILNRIPTNSLLVLKAKEWLDVKIGIGSLHVFEYAFLMLLLVLFFDGIKKQVGESDIMIKVFMVILPLFTILGANVVVSRFKDYFTISYAAILTYLSRLSFGKYKWLIRAAVFIICGMGFFRYILAFDGGTMMPYRSFVFEHISIFE